MIQFQQIPNDIRVPGTYIEINPSRATSGQGITQRILLIGQRNAISGVAALTPTLITSYNQAVSAFGAGSMLANMFKTLFDNNSDTEKWGLALDDVAGGTAASGTITVTATDAETGTLSLYLGGVLIPISVTTADTPTIIGTAIKDAINANTQLPISATNSAGVVTVAYKHKGTVGNKYNMQVNFRGALAGEVLPTGVAVNFVQLTGGATDPDVVSAFAALPDEIFDYIAMPYSNSANLDACDTELNARWGATRMLEGHMFVSERGSVSTVGTLGNGRNNEHMSLFDAGNNSPTPPYVWLSALVGRVAKAASADPALPFTDIEISGVLAPPSSDRRTQSENNTLLYDGVATHRVKGDGKVYIERLITTYQTSGVNLPDATYLDANTPFTLARLRQELRAHIGTRFARVKLADNGTQTQVGTNVVTPAAIKAEIAAKAGEWSARGLIEKLAEFIASIVVERDATDPTRVNVIIYPNLVNQLQVVAVQIQFTL